MVYSWRSPVMHFMVLFCLYHQALSYENKYKNAEHKPRAVRYIKAAREWKEWYWERMCDLRRKE